jgi:hypothetical protein
MVAAAPASATGFHSSPVFGSISQLVRSGAPMILAICGLTVEGTGTDRAGTFSTPASEDWARAADEPAAPIAAHKIMTADRRMASVGFLIAFSLLYFLYFYDRFCCCLTNTAVQTRQASLCNTTSLALFHE